MANRIQLRRGTAAEWAAANPVLAQGEPGVETDTGKQKFGNGVAAWATLPYASKGDQGIPGVADDTSVKNLITTPGSQTATALSATYGLTRSQLVTAGAEPLTKRGIVLFESNDNGTFDKAMVESPCVFRDPVTGKLAMLFTAYTATDGTAVASHGIAYSTDGIRWTDRAQYFTASGTVGAPDEKGVTGPVTIFDGGTQHVFYIGLTEVGYEAGTKTLCRASRPIGTGAWTRHGAVMVPGGLGWRQHAIWHPSFVKHKGKWYCFINASGSPDNHERIGVAEADTLEGPWTYRDDISPLLSDMAGTEYGIQGGDPFVRQLPDGSFRMDFFRAGNNASGYGNAYDTYATTTTEEFPGGWVEGHITVKPTPDSYDSLYAHKPWVVEFGGREFHYYTAVSIPGLRRIALATSGGGHPGIVTGTDSLSRALARTGLAIDASAPTLSDNFTRANGAVGDATTGQAWTTGAGWAIASNKLSFTGTSDANAWINPGVAEWDAELVIDSLTGGPYPFGVGIGDPAGTWVKVYRDNGLWRCGVYNGAALIGTLKDTSGLLPVGTVMVRRRKNMFTIEAGGVVINSPIYTEPTGTQFGILGSGNFPLTISRLTLIKHNAPIKPA